MSLEKVLNSARKIVATSLLTLAASCWAKEDESLNSAVKPVAIKKYDGFWAANSGL